MNLFKILYTYIQPSVMIVEAENVEEATERFAINTDGAIDPLIQKIVRLDEVPETSPVPRNELN